MPLYVQIILILCWHYQVINKVIWFFLQSAIEKLTHDYLNLFHFPPLIKVSQVFSFWEYAAFIDICTCHLHTYICQCRNSCLKWNLIIPVQQKALWVKLRMCLNWTSLFFASWNINSTFMIRPTHVTLVARGWRGKHCRGGPLASHLSLEALSDSKVTEGIHTLELCIFICIWWEIYCLNNIFVYLTYHFEYGLKVYGILYYKISRYLHLIHRILLIHYQLWFPSLSLEGPFVPLLGPPSAYALRTA